MKEKERKEALMTPMDPLPERKLCAYEIIRDNNIKEREKAMLESGFFKDLNDYKEEIGISKKSVLMKESQEENFEKKKTSMKDKEKNKERMLVQKHKKDSIEKRKKQEKNQKLPKMRIHKQQVLRCVVT